MKKQRQRYGEYGDVFQMEEVFKNERRDKGEWRNEKDYKKNDELCIRSIN